MIRIQNALVSLTVLFAVGLTGCSATESDEGNSAGAETSSPGSTSSTTSSTISEATPSRGPVYIACPDGGDSIIGQIDADTGVHRELRRVPGDNCAVLLDNHGREVPFGGLSIRQNFNSDFTKMATDDEGSLQHDIGYIDLISGEYTSVTKFFQDKIADFQPAPNFSEPMFDKENHFIFYDKNLDQFNYLNLDTMQIVKTQTSFPNDPGTSISSFSTTSSVVRLGADGVVIPVPPSGCSDFVAPGTGVEVSSESGLWWIGKDRYLQRDGQAHLTIATAPASDQICSTDPGVPVSPPLPYVVSAVSDPTGQEILFVTSPDPVVVDQYLYRANLSDPNSPTKIPTDPEYFGVDFVFIDWVTE